MKRAPKRQPPAVPGGFQIFPELAPEHYASLKGDIAVNGVQVPIEVDDSGVIIDGHHRVRAWNELRREGIRVPDYPRTVRRFASDEDRLLHALRLNHLRRHLSVEQQKALMHKLRRRGLSLRTIAGELRLGKSTIAREVSRVPDGTPEKVTGLDGRNYPANRRPSVTVNSARDEERVRLAFQELDGALPTRPTTLARLEKRVKAARVRIGDSPDHSVQGGAGWRIDCTDLREWDLEDNSVDLILTDPPYTNEGLPLYNDLAQFGARVLRPGGLLIAYCGKLHLPDIYDHLFTELEYVWQGIVVQNSRSTRIHVRKMQGGYRPFLICSKGSYVPSRWMYDTITSTKAPEKDLHPWQQSLNPFLELVEMASKRGELICDPFTGSGTTGVAALMLGRSFVGCEIDPRTAKEASARLTTVDETKAET